MNNEDLNEDLFGGWLILDRADNNKNKKLIDYCKKKLAKNHTLSLDDNTYTFKPRKEKKINFKKGKEINLGGVTTTGKGYVGDPNQSLLDLKKVASGKFVSRDQVFEFRIGQEEILRSVLANPGKNVLGTLPTGGGKSLIYELAAYDLNKNQEGPTVVISPLHSLQEDQVENLKKRWKKELDPVNLNGAFSLSQKSSIHSKVLTERSDLILMSPETILPLGGHSQMKYHFLFSKMHKYPSLFVIDEFHLIKEWGEDFRHSMLHLGSVIRWLRLKNPHMRVLFLTATLGPGMKEEIEKILQIRKDSIIDPLREIDKEGVEKLLEKFNNSKNFGIRDNLKIQTWSEGTFWDNLEKKDFNSVKDGPVIIYKAHSKKAEKIKDDLKRRFPQKSITHYVGDMDDETKKKTSVKFRNGEIDILVATSAFGLGVDNQNVNNVIFHGDPYSVEQIYQAFGRGGRSKVEDASCNAYWYLDRSPVVSRSKLTLAKFKRKAYSMLKESIDVADGWRLVPMNMIDNSSPDALSRKVAANKKSEEALAEFRYYVLGMMQKASILEPWGFFHETWEFYKKGKRNISREKIDRLFESLNSKSDSPVRNLLTNIENIDDSKDLSFCNSALYCLVRFNKKFDYFSQILQAIESEYLSSKKKKTKDINNVQKLRSGEECLLKIFNKQINRYPTKEIETCVTKYENGEYKSFCPYCLSNEEKILEDSPLEGYFDVDSGGVILINTLRNCKQTECFYLRASDTRRLIDKQGLSEGSDRKVKARIIFNEGTKIVDSEVLLSSRNQRHVFHFNFKLDEGFSLNHAQHGFEDSNPVICISKSKQKEGFDEYGFDLNVLPQEWYKNNSAKCKQYFKIAFPEPCEDL